MTKTVAAERVPTPNGDSPATPVPGAGFMLTLPNFEGPFDLLLTLISRRKLDITDIALAEVTDEFLGYLHALYKRGTTEALDEASDFLVTAATLLELKAARLLPRTNETIEQDAQLLEARDLLFARLLQYRAYREVAAFFAERWRGENQRFARTVALEPVFAKALPELVFEGGPEQFARIAAKVFTTAAPGTGHTAQAVADELNEHLHVSLTTIAEQEHHILDALAASDARSACFTELVRGAGELEIAVVRFLALLELYKEGTVRLHQQTPLGEIMVSPARHTDGFIPRDPAKAAIAGSASASSAAGVEPVAERQGAA